MARDAAALYALRNALLHSYALSNRNSSRPDLRRTFSLEAFGPMVIVEHPAMDWTGDPNEVTNQITTVSLQHLRNLADNLVFALQETWATTKKLAIVNGKTPASIRRDYLMAQVHPSRQDNRIPDNASVRDR